MEYSTVELEAAELERAEMLWIRSIQAEAFCREIQYLEGNLRYGKPVYVEQFGVYLDDCHVRDELRTRFQQQLKSTLCYCLPNILLLSCW